ncbi:hypothetical protein M3Y95_01047000 [Aphelenchoides besseyi]|nr:hypothetical protein M3Y95_01047000 [Aphelenchoides besseyi]
MARISNHSWRLTASQKSDMIAAKLEVDTDIKYLRELVSREVEDIKAYVLAMAIWNDYKRDVQSNLKTYSFLFDDILEATDSLEARHEATMIFSETCRKGPNSIAMTAKNFASYFDCVRNPSVLELKIQGETIDLIRYLKKHITEASDIVTAEEMGIYNTFKQVGDYEKVKSIVSSIKADIKLEEVQFATMNESIEYLNVKLRQNNLRIVERGDDCLLTTLFNGAQQNYTALNEFTQIIVQDGAEFLTYGAYCASLIDYPNTTSERMDQVFSVVNDSLNYTNWVVITKKQMQLKVDDIFASEECNSGNCYPDRLANMVWSTLRHYVMPPYRMSVLVTPWTLGAGLYMNDTTFVVVNTYFRRRFLFTRVCDDALMNGSTIYSQVETNMSAIASDAFHLPVGDVIAYIMKQLPSLVEYYPYLFIYDNSDNEPIPMYGQLGQGFRSTSWDHSGGGYFVIHWALVKSCPVNFLS